MKEIIGSYTIEAKPVLLYLEDLLEVTKIIQSSNPKSLIINSDRWSIDNFTELESIKCKPLNDLTIESYCPSVTLRLHSSYAEVYISENNPVSRGIAEKIAELLRMRRQPLWWLTSGFVASALSGGAIGSITWVLIVPKQFRLIFCILMATLWCIFETASRHRLKRYSIIIFKRRPDQTNFFSRKKDEILLLIIGAVVGGLVTWLLN